MEGEVIVLGESQVTEQLSYGNRTVPFPELIISVPGLKERAQNLAAGIGSQFYQNERFFERLAGLCDELHPQMLIGLANSIAKRANGRVSPIWVILEDSQVAQEMSLAS